MRRRSRVDERVGACGVWMGFQEMRHRKKLQPPHPPFPDCLEVERQKLSSPRVPPSCLKWLERWQLNVGMDGFPPRPRPRANMAMPTIAQSVKKEPIPTKTP